MNDETVSLISFPSDEHEKATTTHMNKKQPLSKRFGVIIVSKPKSKTHENRNPSPTLEEVVVANPSTSTTTSTLFSMN